MIYKLLIGWWLVIIVYLCWIPLILMVLADAGNGIQPFEVGLEEAKDIINELRYKVWNYKS